MRDFVENVTQKYWNYISRGTIAENAKITFNIIPTSSLCKDCGHVTEFDWYTANELVCGDCQSKNCILLTGQELSIEEIAISSE